MASMTVAKKFFLTTGGLLIALAGVGGVAIYNLASLNKITQLIITELLPGIMTITTHRATAVGAWHDYRDNRGGWRSIGVPHRAQHNQDAAADCQRTRGRR